MGGALCGRSLVRLDPFLAPAPLPGEVGGTQVAAHRQQLAALPVDAGQGFASLHRQARRRRIEAGAGDGGRGMQALRGQQQDDACGAGEEFHRHASSIDADAAA